MMKINQIKNKSDLLLYLDSSKRFGDIRKSLEKYTPELLKEIEGSWKFEHEPSRFIEIVYQYLKPTDPTCQYGTLMKYEGWRKGYICYFTCKCTRDKQKKTMMERYGVEHSLQSKQIYEKFENTLEERYGSRKLRVAFDSKIKATNREKYGHDSHLKDDNIRQKIEQTNKEKYGGPSPFHNDNIQKKAKDTVKEEYGVDNILQLKENQIKSQKAIKEKYGVETIFYLDSFKNKRKETWKELYGVEHPSLRNIKKDKLEEWLDDKSFMKIYHEMNSVKEIRTYFGVMDTAIHQRAARMKLPLKKNWVSNEEIEVFDFVKSLDINVVQSDRKIIHPKELDIVSHKYKIAIEYNGIYRHSTEFCDCNIHLLKTDLATKQGYKLIHVFSDEWLFKQDIVKDKIKNIFGKNEQIDIRNCQWREISLDEYNIFFKENNLEYEHNCDIAYGIEYENFIIMAVGFVEISQDNYQIKYTDKIGYNADNGISYILDYFCKKHNPENIELILDRRWPVDINLPVNDVCQTEPNWMYVKNSKRIYETTDDCHKIYDCGNLIINIDLKELENE